jgi:SEC-C motif-containing protein
MIKNLLSPKHECPCGSGKSFNKCCKPYLDGNPAPTAENLMRARYTAYCLLNNEYLLHSWHPGSRPKQIKLTEDSGVHWLKLEIIRCEQGSANDKMGIIEFKAFYEIDGKTGYLHETSNFVKEDSQWYYFDGEIEFHNDDEQDDFKDFKPVRRLSVET